MCFTMRPRRLCPFRVLDMSVSSPSTAGDSYVAVGVSGSADDADVSIIGGSGTDPLCVALKACQGTSGVDCDSFCCSDVTVVSSGSRTERPLTSGEASVVAGSVCVWRASRDVFSTSLISPALLRSCAFGAQLVLITSHRVSSRSVHPGWSASGRGGRRCRSQTTVSRFTSGVFANGGRPENTCAMLTLVSSLEQSSAG